jgi:hypothetical protein
MLNDEIISLNQLKILGQMTEEDSIIDEIDI